MIATLIADPDPEHPRRRKVAQILTPKAPRASCRTCRRRWNGLAECHCSVCHRHFSAIGPFDAHRSEDRCLDPATATRSDGQPMFEPRERVDGIVWVKYDRREHPFVEAVA